MTSTDERGAESGTEQFLKSMKWETNSSTLASILRSACRNLDEKRPGHRQVQATGDLKGFVARHPLALGKVMLTGLKQQRLIDGRFSVDRYFCGESCRGRACDDRSRSRLVLGYGR